MKLGLACALAGVLVLSACSGDEDPAPETPSDGATASAPADDAAATSAAPEEASGDPLTRWLTPVEIEDAPRELTEVEESVLFEAGPYANFSEMPAEALLSDADREAAAAAAAALDPQTEEEWIGAVLAQVHGDYADDVRATVFFDTSTGEGSDGPGSDAEPPVADVGTNHYAVVLDASGSMADAAPTGTRMDEAKAAIETFVRDLPEDSTVSLRIYGHEGDNTDAGKDESCRSSEVVFEGQSQDEAGLADALSGVDPVGWTPLARAIEDAQGDIPAEATDSIVYVVTDGIETCGGDPVAASRGLAQTDIQPVVNVIGFQTGNADQAALAAIAEAGGGEFTAAGSGAELDAYWAQERQRMEQAWSQWRQQELTRIREAGEANKRSATEIGQRIKTTSTIEEQAGKDVAKELQRQGLVDDDTASAVWTWFDERSSPIWNYGNDTGSENWVASDDRAEADIAELYAKADRTWTELYRGED